MFTFDVKDTIGYLFFTIRNQLILLNIEVKLKTKLTIKTKKILQIPYTKFRYLNCINIINNNNNPLNNINNTMKNNNYIFIGIIE